MLHTVSGFAAKLWAEMPVRGRDGELMPITDKTKLFALWLTSSESFTSRLSTQYNNPGHLVWSPSMSMKAMELSVRINRVHMGVEQNEYFCVFECFEDFYKLAAATTDIPPTTGVAFMEATRLMEGFTERRLFKEKQMDAFIRVTRAGRRDEFGLELLNVSLVVGGLIESTLLATSGQPGRQAFRTQGASKSGSMEPLPEGYWTIDYADWAGAEGDFTKTWGPGLGAYVVGLNNPNTARTAICIHLDSNRHGGAPGTAGCVGMIDITSTQKVAQWFKTYKITRVVSNWGLGTVETQKKPVPPPTTPKGKAPRNGKRVALEIGHGPWRDRDGSEGFEQGANGVGTTEYRQTTYLGQICSRELISRGFDVTLIDSKDSLYDLGAKATGHDVFISLHLNAFNGKAQGTETLIAPNATAGDRKLAQLIQTELVRSLKLTDRGVKSQSLGVLRGVPAGVKGACLVEAFFIDAPKSTAAIVKLTEQSAPAIVEGIVKFLA